MVNITFSVDEDLHKKMKNHPEIKWSEILRQSIREYLERLESPDVIPIAKLRSILEKNLSITSNDIKEFSLEKELDIYKEMKEKEITRMRELLKLEGQGR